MPAQLLLHQHKVSSIYSKSHLQHPASKQLNHGPSLDGIGKCPLSSAGGGGQDRTRRGRDVGTGKSEEVVDQAQEVVESVTLGHFSFTGFKALFLDLYQSH